MCSCLSSNSLKVRCKLVACFYSSNCAQKEMCQLRPTHVNCRLFSKFQGVGQHQSMRAAEI